MAVLEKTLELNKNVAQSLGTLKVSIQEWISRRLDKLEASFHRYLADLGQRLSQLEAKHTALEAEQRAHKPEMERISQNCGIQMKSLETRIETRLAALERKVNGPHPQHITKRVERDSAGLIAKIIEE